MTTRRGFVWSCGLLAAWLGAVDADMVTIPPVRDNTLFEDASGSLSNGAGPVLFAGNNGQDLARRALLQFDVAGNVPAGALIEDVTLMLYVSNAPNTAPRPFTLHRVLEAWGEGTSSTTSGSGAPATANDATWLHCFWSSQLWASIGGDFASTPSGSQEVGGIGSYSWTGAGLSADVQAWLDDPATSFGWLVLGDEVTLNTARRFDSRENTVVANQPALTITYTRTTGAGDEGARSRLSLEPCRPNPTTGAARFGFGLPRSAHVRLEIEDLAGRRVATAADGHFGPGHHEAAWDSRDSRGAPAAPGVYLVRLVVNGQGIAARRLVVVR